MSGFLWIEIFSDHVLTKSIHVTPHECRRERERVEECGERGESEKCDMR